MAEPARSPQTVSARRFDWLRGEVAGWRADGLIDAAQAAAIVERYEPGTIGRQAAQFALWALATLMGAVGVLLVIGYNWEHLPRSVKAALIIGAVAASFAGAAAAYARNHPRAGEMLGFLGVLLYGNAIWLLAQVFHISGHYPDGTLWWFVGALLTAHLLDSPLITGLALGLLAMWVGMEGIAFADDTLLFPLLAAATLRLTYRFKLRILLAAWGAVVLFWLAVQAGIASRAWPLAVVGLVFVAGTAAFATGLLHDERSALRLTWLRMGATFMLVGLFPLMIKEAHRLPPQEFSLRWPLIVFGLLLIAYAWLAAARRRALREALPVLVAAVLVAGGLGLGAFLSRERALPEGATFAFAIGFSALDIVLAVVLLRAGIRLDDLRLFVVGVLFALGFLAVRWIDLIGNMLWSALLLFVAAGGLIVLARMWRHRQPAAGPGGAR